VKTMVFPRAQDRPCNVCRAVSAAHEATLRRGLADASLPVPKAVGVRCRAVTAGIAFALDACAPAGGAPTGQGVRAIAEFGCERGILVRSPAATAAR